MTAVDIVLSTPSPTSTRARQLEAMFDVPRTESSVVEWHGDVDLDAHPWNVGLIVGPSGTGKSTLARHLFPEQPDLAWGGPSVIDDFGEAMTMDAITAACQAVGFNTIPAWLRPYDVLSTGERFRVDLARRLIECGDPIVVDEFTSTVDRQVGKIGAHAVQKYARANDRRFVAVTCHYDVMEWLQPDWVIEPATMTVEWRSVQSRPPLDLTLASVPYDFWRLFAPFHYLTAELNRSARCYCLFVGEQPAAFAGVLHRPHSKVDDIKGVSRLVTLPDWQGLGLAFALVDRLGAAYKAAGYRLHTYPAHPSLVRGFDRSTHWSMTKRPGTYNHKPVGGSSTLRKEAVPLSWKQGSRPNAVFVYAGEAMDDVDAARALVLSDRSSR